MAVAKYAKPDQFYEGVLQSCKWNGKTYGLPASAGDGCIFLNKKIFDAAGVSTKREDFPTTWDGLRALSQNSPKQGMARSHRSAMCHLQVEAAG